MLVKCCLRREFFHVIDSEDGDNKVFSVLIRPQYSNTSDKTQATRLSFKILMGRNAIDMVEMLPTLLLFLANASTDAFADVRV